eukprot:m.249522 g.249522  ORF g.249522 m.249522 type:complete len:1477 (+) comp17166_c0_seq5:141-4571(+)
MSRRMDPNRRPSSPPSSSTSSLSPSISSSRSGSPRIPPRRSAIARKPSLPADDGGLSSSSSAPLSLAPLSPSARQSSRHLSALSAEGSRTNANRNPLLQATPLQQHTNNDHLELLKREKQQELEKIMEQRKLVEEKLAEAQRIAQTRKQQLLQQFGPLKDDARPSPRRAEKNSADDDDEDDLYKSLLSDNGETNLVSPMNQAGRGDVILQSTPFPHRLSQPRQSQGAPADRRSSLEVTIPAYFFKPPPEDVNATLSEIRMWRKNYIQNGGMDPGILTKLHEAETNCRNVANQPNLSQTNRDTASPSSLNTSSFQADLASVLKHLHVQDTSYVSAATMTPEMIRLLVQQELAQHSVKNSLGRSETDAELTEDERLEARRLRHLQQQAEILRKEAELKQLQQSLQTPAKIASDEPLPMTPPEQDTDVLNPGPYDSEEGFVVYLDFAARLPAWLRRCSLTYRLFAAGKPQSKAQSSLAVNAVPSTEKDGVGLLTCIFEKTYFAVKQCPPIPSLHLLIELRNRTSTSDEGSLAAWCKLYFFSQKQLVSGRWRLRLLQPPMDEKCFSTDLLAAPTFYGADLCVRLVDGRAKSRHDTLQLQPIRHRYLPNGIMGQDIIYILQRQAKQAAARQLQEQRRLQHHEQEPKQPLQKASRALSAASRNPTPSEHQANEPLVLKGLSVSTGFDAARNRNALPLALNISAAVGYLQNGFTLLASRNMLPSWCCLRLSLVLPSTENMAALTLAQVTSDLFYLSLEAQYSTDDNINLPINQRITLKDIQLQDTADINMCFELLYVPSSEAVGDGDQHVSLQWKSMLIDELPRPTKDDLDNSIIIMSGITALAPLQLMEPVVVSITLNPIEPTQVSDAQSLAGLESAVSLVTEVLIDVIREDDVDDSPRTAGQTRERLTTTKHRNGTSPLTAGSVSQTFDRKHSATETPQTFNLEKALKLIPEGAYIYKEIAPPTAVYQATHGFDLYIDGARFLPYNTTITKVVGRIFNVNKQVQKTDITTGLDLDSDVFNPKYDLRLEFREPIFTPTSTLVVQVYNVDRYTHALSILGYAALNLFVVQGTHEVPESDTLGRAVSLNEGGHQLRIHSQSFTASDQLNVNVMATKPVIPCASLLIRLVPSLKDADGHALSMADIPKAEWQASGLVVPAPIYRSGAYASVACTPIPGEPHIYQELVRREPETVRDVCATIADEKQSKQLTSDKRRQHFIRTRLTRSSDASAPLTELSYITPVNPLHGIQLVIEKAFNLPKPKLAMAVATLCPPCGQYLQDRIEPSDRTIQWTRGWNLEDPLCSLRCPFWIDQPLVFNEAITAKSFFVIDVYVIDVKVQLATVQAHTIFSCIKKDGFVTCGGFQLPLFQGKCNVDILNTLLELGEDITDPDKFASVIEQAVKKKQLKVMDGASIFVYTADARLDHDLAYLAVPQTLYPWIVDKKSKTIVKSKRIESVLKNKETMDDLEAKVFKIMTQALYSETET